jgi:hypothetical protein
VIASRAETLARRSAGQVDTIVLAPEGSFAPPACEALIEVLTSNASIGALLVAVTGMGARSSCKCGSRASGCSVSTLRFLPCGSSGVEAVAGSPVEREIPFPQRREHVSHYAIHLRLSGDP